MNSKQTPTRVFGQYTIASTFLSRSSNFSEELKEDSRNKDSKKFTSLSDFLNRKLPRSSGIPKTVQEKSRPFSSLLLRKEGDSVNKQNESKKEEETEKKDVIDKVVFEQFKQDSTEKVDCMVSSGGVGEEEEKEETSRKRQNPFEGLVEEHRTRRPFLVLGDDPPKPKKRGRRECSLSNKKPKPHYNHYANGCGWWDCDMEGVDSEEVGSGEVWEGVGSTTFGGIVDWH
ncbi:PREDICTED: uncharacterized protein LOC18602755 isoform X1 [Theobroma cacao]|uniref:Uncharacterized protein LOC18602755 isoform X1 n=1 Tax=Theobroma cacao TaxID=3641 RepID=A0AB32VAZ3_THECC|nr:PREDICTED: uncharacterized protein LOC18602755 isoform X1 [Theobroma cacao]